MRQVPKILQQRNQHAMRTRDFGRSFGAFRDGGGDRGGGQCRCGVGIAHIRRAVECRCVREMGGGRRFG